MTTKTPCRRDGVNRKLMERPTVYDRNAASIRVKDFDTRCAPGEHSYKVIIHIQVWDSSGKRKTIGSLTTHSEKIRC